MELELPRFRRQLSANNCRLRHRANANGLLTRLDGCTTYCPIWPPVQAQPEPCALPLPMPSYYQLHDSSALGVLPLDNTLT